MLDKLKSGNSDSSIQSSTLASQARPSESIDDDVDDLAKWEEMMDQERRNRMNEVTRESYTSDNHAGTPTRKAPTKQSGTSI